MSHRNETKNMVGDMYQLNLGLNITGDGSTIIQDEYNSWIRTFVMRLTNYSSYPILLMYTDPSNYNHYASCYDVLATSLLSNYTFYFLRYSTGTTTEPIDIQMNWSYSNSTISAYNTLGVNITGMRFAYPEWT